MVDTVADAFEKLTAVFRESDPTKKKEMMTAFTTEELPKHLKNLEVLEKLYGNGGSFFVNNQLTWADLFFYDIGQSFLEADQTCLDNYPWLKQNHQETEKHPKVAEYLKNRPKT